MAARMRSSTLPISNSAVNWHVFRIHASISRVVVTYVPPMCATGSPWFAIQSYTVGRDTCRYTARLSTPRIAPDGIRGFILRFSTCLLRIGGTLASAASGVKPRRTNCSCKLPAAASSRPLAGAP